MRFARLAVLVGDVVDGLVVPDVAEVLAHGVSDVDLAQIDAQGVGELGGVVVRAVGGAKARHGHGDDSGTVQVEQVKGAHGHQQRQSGVKAAGDADNGVAGVGVRQALGQAVGLDVEDVLAALRAAGRVCRHKRVRVHVARKTRLALVKREVRDVVATLDATCGNIKR